MSDIHFMSDTHSPKLAVRLQHPGWTWLNRLVAETGRNRTAVVKACLDVAARYEGEVRALLASNRRG